MKFKIFHSRQIRLYCLGISLNNHGNGQCDKISRADGTHSLQRVIIGQNTHSGVKGFLFFPFKLNGDSIRQTKSENKLIQRNNAIK
jgi:hypothetical protein